MKRFLPNLLIFFSLSLCALIAFQWVREARVRAELQGLKDELHSKLEAIQSLEGTVKDRNAEIGRIDSIRKDFEGLSKSNRMEIATLLKRSDKAESELDLVRRQLDGYKDAVTTANDRLKKQNEDILRQNGDIRKLIAERNTILTNYNDVAAKYSELVKQWNEQQKEIAKSNEAQAAAAAAVAEQARKK